MVRHPTRAQPRALAGGHFRAGAVKIAPLQGSVASLHIITHHALHPRPVFDSPSLRTETGTAASTVIARWLAVLRHPIHSPSCTNVPDQEYEPN